MDRNLREKIFTWMGRMGRNLKEDRCLDRDFTVATEEQLVDQETEPVQELKPAEQWQAEEDDADALEAVGGTGVLARPE